MKKLLLLAIAAVAAMNLTGCVILHSQTVIKDDGSGTAEITMSIAPEVREAQLEMKALDGGQSQDMDLPILGDMSKADIEKMTKGHNVKVENFERALVDGRETMTIALAFADLKGFSYTMGQIMGGSESGDGMGIFDAGDGNLVLKQAKYEYPTEAEAEEAPAPPADPLDADPTKAQKQMELAGKLMAAMAELDLSIKITVPGDIVSSNAPTTDGRTSIWAVDASNMMTMGQEFNPTIVFAGEGLKIKPIAE
jgi:hypothetical protein